MLNRKNFAALLLISIMVCTATFTLLGGVDVAHISQPIGEYCNVNPDSGSMVYQHDAGPYSDNATLVNIWGIRTVDIGDYGLLSANDTIMVHNNGSVEASSWMFYLPSDTYPQLRYIAAFGNGTQLDVVGAESFEGFVGMRVDLAKANGLAANYSLRVNLIQQYSGLITPDPASGTKAKLFFYKFLVSPYTIMDYNTSVRLPTGATTSEPTEFVGLEVLPFNCTRLGSSSDGSYTYTLSGQSLIEVDVDRVVQINADGFISVTETHRLKNIGPASLATVRFMLPLSIIPGSLEASDSSGMLSATANGRVVSVSLRYSVGVNWTFVYYVGYRAYLDDYRTTENGLYVLRMLPVTVYNASVGLETTSIVLPPHAQLYSASQSPREIKIEGDAIVTTYEFREVTTLNTGSVELRYGEDLSQILQRPLVLALGVFLIGLFYVGIRKVMPGAGPVAAAKETAEKVRGLTGVVKEFCSKYEEKTALTLELENLAEDRRKGRISKRAFAERLQLARQRIASLANGINEAKKKLIPASKRYAALIRQIDTYEEERENARASLDNLELRRRQGKVSGDVYSRLKYENSKKIEKATAGIDSIIIQMRQEAV